MRSGISIVLLSALVVLLIPTPGATAGLSSSALLASPSDSCSTAPLISPGLHVGDTSGATTDGASTCAGEADVWYRFDAPGAGMVLIDTCASAFDTILSIHSACPGDISNQLACSDNATSGGPCAGAGSTASFLCAHINAGETWYIRVAGAAGASGPFNLRLTFAPGSGITVLTHGFQLSDGPDTAAPTWLFTMARAIQKRAPASRVALYEPALQQFLQGTFSSGGAWQPSPNPLIIDPAQETILIFDWTVESGGLFKNDFRYEGWSEGAADAMVAALTDLTCSVDALALYHWHFIGHSRGAVVNSEAVERLAALGAEVDQLTALDPHDFDQSVVPFDEDWRDWMLGQPQAPNHAWQSSWGFTTWTNVVHADNFFSTESSFLTPDGRPSGSRSRELNVGALSPATIDHSGVHAWYHGTIDPSATTDGDGYTMQANWYPGDTRRADGWNQSRLGGVPRPGPTNGLSVYDPLWRPLEDGVFNGGFELHSPVKPDPIAGWYLHGGNQVEDTIVAEAGGNHYLQLSAANPIATHNRCAVPAQATHLRLRLPDAEGLRAAPPGVLFLFDQGVELSPPAAMYRGAAWTWVDYEIPLAAQGHTAIFSVMLPKGGASAGIDDLQFANLAPPCPCPGDADGSLAIDFDDITAILSSWGATYPGATGPGDANCDAAVTFDDITATLSLWGSDCPGR